MTKATYTVFISSTYLDNIKRRKEVEAAVIDAGMLPICMERFTAGIHPTVEECQRMASEADLFIGIFAYRYGWIPEGYDVSITELEYIAAKQSGKPRLMFVLDPKVSVNPLTEFDQGDDKWDKQKKLDGFRDAFSKDQIPGQFEDETLGRKVLKAIQDWKDKQDKPSQPRQRRESSREPLQGLSEEMKDYCAKVITEYAFLPLAGFKTRLRVPINLEDLYVPLRAMVDLRGVGEAGFFDADDAESQLNRSEYSREINLINAFTEAEKRNQSGLVILGDPGSGKTTHLKRLLLKCLREGSESLGLAADMVPVFLPLRELGNLKKGMDSFIQAQLDHPHLSMKRGFGRRLLDRGNLLLLLDGLDEVADESKRKKVSRWIDNAQKIHASCRCVVTCRFAGYTAASRLSERFMELHIRPLDEEQAEAFVTNWYRIVEQGLTGDPAKGEMIGREKAAELLESLRKPEFRARRVFSMTRNPLLLANLCLVHFDRKKLPQRRADLYEECIDVLLERWREAKELKATITAKTGRRVLQPAALWLHQEENRTRASAKELAPVIEPVLKTTEYTKGDAKQFLKTIRDESGLVVGWGDESYGFMHLGFQEYLAAREIGQRSYQDKSILKELAGRFGESWWQEVSLLLLALEEFPCFEPFMREILKTQRFVDHQNLFETYLDDAIAISEKPFIELIEKTPGKDKGLWQRQLLALRILERLKSEKLAVLRKKLKEHPSPEIRSWLGNQKAKAAKKTITTERGGYELVLIPGGVFQMGSPESEEGRFDRESPIHEVQISSFYMGCYPVTNQEYGRFLSDNPNIEAPLYWAESKYNQPRQPVVGVSWFDAQKYAKWEGLRLPCEAEWEYACRAGTTTRYHGGDHESDLDRIGWYWGNSEVRLYPIGEKQPNAFGLYDMHGNVLEWVEDDWHDSYKGAPRNEKAWVNNPREGGRVLRGGSWDDFPQYCRSAYRSWHLPGSRSYDVGFRLVLDLK